MRSIRDGKIIITSRGLFFSLSYKSICMLDCLKFQAHLFQSICASLVLKALSLSSRFIVEEMTIEILLFFEINLLTRSINIVSLNSSIFR
jgi:hypothetical protein